jgi:hypothetical protein
MAIGKSNLLRTNFDKSDFEIVNHYFGVTSIPCKIKAPYRIEKTPSVYLYSTDGVSIYYRDFGNDNHGPLIDLLANTFCGNDVSKIRQLPDKINKEVGLMSDSLININTVQFDSYTKEAINKAKIDISIRQTELHDIKFWGQYGITPEWCKFGQIYPINYIFITKGKQTSFYPCEKFAYAYAEFKENNVSYKIYQPYSTRMKWLSQHKRDVWDLWSQLPKQMDNLIITKSRKDALSIWANTGIPSTSLQGEGYIPKKHVVEELKNRANKVFLLYDNDFDKDVNVGREYGAIIALKFDLKQIEIPTELQSKDASDLYKIHGALKQKQIINDLIC